MKFFFYFRDQTLGIKSSHAVDATKINYAPLTFVEKHSGSGGHAHYLFFTKMVLPYFGLILQGHMY